MPFDWKRYQSQYVKFETEGTMVEGTVLTIKEGRTFKGDPCPELDIETREGIRTVTAGQAALVARLAETCPEVGDQIRITFDGEDTANKKPGQNPVKLFTVTVKRAGGQDPPPTPETWKETESDPF